MVMACRMPLRGGGDGWRGQANRIDTDDDGDGLATAFEGVSDPDGDGLANYLDTDATMMVSRRRWRCGSGRHDQGAPDRLHRCTAFLRRPYPIYRYNSQYRFRSGHTDRRCGTGSCQHRVCGRQFDGGRCVFIKYTRHG